MLGARELLDADDARPPGRVPLGSRRASSPASSPPSRPRARTTSTTPPCGATSPKGRPGVALTLRLTVVERVDLQADQGRGGRDLALRRRAASTRASSQQGTEDERFLRGVQRTDAKGLAIFRTIYPGWYQGRTVHIHTMVHIGGNVVHTGQLYFSDAVTDAVYKRSPYNQRPNRNPRNSGDSIYRNGGKRSTLKLVKNGVRVHGLDHDGRPALVAASAIALHRSVYPNLEPRVLSYEPLSRERRDAA